MLRFAVATATILGLLTISAQARSTPENGEVSEFCGDRYCSHITTTVFPRIRMPRKEPAEARCTHHGCREARSSKKTIHNHPTQTAGYIVEHPAGCPRTRFCGCGVALKVFGRAIRAGGLAQAKAWLGFPAASPAAGMVAANHHHVVYIEEYLGNGMAKVYDPNSGGHQTRVHVRSLAGFSVRNPHGSRMAGL